MCVPVWPRPLTWRSVCAGSWLAFRCRRSWLALRICLFPAGIQLRNRQFQAGLWRTPVSRQLCQLLDQLCGTQTSWPHPAWFTLKSYSEAPLGFVFLCCFFLSHPWVTGTNEQNASTAKFTSMNLYEEFSTTWGARDCGNSVIPTDDPNLSCGSHCQALGFEVKLSYPNCLWHQKFANLSLALLRCFKIWTTIFFIWGIICCCSIETVKNWHLKKNKLLLKDWNWQECFEPVLIYI